MYLSQYQIFRRQGFIKEKTAIAYTARRKGNYIGVARYCGQQQQIFAHGAPTSANIHAIFKS